MKSYVWRKGKNRPAKKETIAAIAIVVTHQCAE